MRQRCCLILFIVTQLTELLLTLDRVHTHSWGGKENNLFFVLFYKTLLQHKAEQNCVRWGKKQKVCSKKKIYIVDWIAIIGMKSHTCAGFIDFIKVNVVLQSWKTEYLETWKGCSRLWTWVLKEVAPFF